MLSVLSELKETFSGRNKRVIMNKREMWRLDLVGQPVTRLALRLNCHHVLPSPPPSPPAAHGCLTTFIDGGITVSPTLAMSPTLSPRIVPFAYSTAGQPIELHLGPGLPAGEQGCVGRPWLDYGILLGRSCCEKRFSCSPPALLFQSWFFC